MPTSTGHQPDGAPTGSGDADQPRALSPIDGVNGVSPRPVFAIELPAIDRGATLATQWQIAPNPEFKGVLYDRGVFDTTNHVALANLPFGQTCYWRARLLRQQGWSPWSKPAAFTTCASPGPNCHVFQDGCHGYDGTRDADMRGSGQDPSKAIREWNQGRQDVLRTGRRGVHGMTDEIKRSLLKFDLSALSKTDAVVSAYLVLTGWEHDRRDPPVRGQALNRIYRVRRAWSEGTGVKDRAPREGEVSWSFSAYPQRWGQPGAARQSDDPQADADTDATPLGELTVISRLGAKMLFSSPRFIEAVKAWIADPASNHGLLIRIVDETIRETLNIASREHPAASYRPKLVVESYEQSPFEAPPAHYADP